MSEIQAMIKLPHVRYMIWWLVFGFPFSSYLLVLAGLPVSALTPLCSYMGVLVGSPLVGVGIMSYIKRQENKKTD